MSAEAAFVQGDDALAGWRRDILAGKPPTLFPVGTGDLTRIEVGPGLVTLLGDAPGVGKSAFSTQLVIDALRLTPTLRAVVCNVKMTPTTLLDRQLARLSGVDLTLIRHRRLGPEHADRIDQAMATLQPVAERLAFVRPPFDLASVAATADTFEAQLLLLDYLQRVSPPGEYNDKRNAVNATMDYLRRFADAGVVVVSAVGRTKDSRGRSSYAADALGLASFRESSELEFGADDAFMLTADDNRGEAVTLRHLKSRHGECRDIALTFYRRHQPFTQAGGWAIRRPEEAHLVVHAGIDAHPDLGGAGLGEAARRLMEGDRRRPPADGQADVRPLAAGEEQQQVVLVQGGVALQHAGGELPGVVQGGVEVAGTVDVPPQERSPARAVEALR